MASNGEKKPIKFFRRDRDSAETSSQLKEFIEKVVNATSEERRIKEAKRAQEEMRVNKIKREEAKKRMDRAMREHEERRIKEIERRGAEGRSKQAKRKEEEERIKEAKRKEEEERIKEAKREEEILRAHAKYDPNELDVKPDTRVFPSHDFNGAARVSLKTYSCIKWN
jgi:hypothetical protein